MMCVDYLPSMGKWVINGLGEIQEFLCERKLTEAQGWQWGSGVCEGFALFLQASSEGLVFASS